MKKRNILAILVASFISGSLWAQTEPVEIAQSSEYYYRCLEALPNGEFLACSNNWDTRTFRIQRFNGDGEVLQETVHPDYGYQLYCEEIFQDEEGYNWMIGGKNYGGSLRICVGLIGDDLFFNETGSFPFEKDYVLPLVYRNADGTFIMSCYKENYRASQYVRIVRFDEMGNVLADRSFVDDMSANPQYGALLNYTFVPDANGEKFYFAFPYYYTKDMRVDCFELDKDLNSTLFREDVFRDLPQHSFPMIPYTVRHPQTGEVLVMGELSLAPSNGQTEVVQDAMIAKLDSEFLYQGMAWGKTTQTHDQRSLSRAIDFGQDGSIYMCAYMDNLRMHDFCVSRFDTNLHKLDEVFYHSPLYSTIPYYISVLTDGSCVISTNGSIRNSSEYVISNAIFHIPAEAFLSIEEAHANGLSLAIAYPNPGGSEMHIRTAVEDAAVEVYDMNGRLVAQQPVTETETVLDATDWAAGTYVWKVVSGVSTLRQSSATAGSTTLVETGKWVKE